MAATSLPAPSVFSPHALLEVESSLSPLPENILTAPAFCRTLNFPKLRRLAGAFASVPSLVKIAAFSVSATSAPRGRGFILADSIREDWRPSMCRGALFRLFLYPVTQSPKHRGVPCPTFPLTPCSKWKAASPPCLKIS